MGILTLTNAATGGLSFETEVRRLLDDNQDEPQARIFRFVQDAYDFVSNPGIFRHRGLFTDKETALNNTGNEYSFTGTTWLHPTVVSIVEAVPGSVQPTDNRWKLDYTTLAQLDNMKLSKSRPSAYAFDGGTFYLDAIPSDTLNGKTLVARGYVRGTKLTSFSSTNTATTALDDEWDTIICYLAAMYGWLFLRDSGKAMDFREDAGRLINEQRAAAELAAFDWRHTIINDGPDYMRIS